MSGGIGPIQVAIPCPIQIVIDDVGWWSGTDGSTYQEPYRTGIARNHVPADYAALISLGRQLGMKPQAAMILCEWDTKNLLRSLPSSTWMGEAWDNSKWCGPWLDEAADILRQGHNYFELTLHGIGHEYWQLTGRGTHEFTRAEWHDRDGQMRLREELVRRLELFATLLEQHNLGPFPTSFVPCAFMHRFAGEGEEGLASLLKRYGITFISTPFRTMHGTEHVQHGRFGYDDGVMTVDRGQDLQRWFSIGAPPSGELSGPICGMHWPNFLHIDPQRNEEVVTSWVDYLRGYQARLYWMLAPDTAAFAAQLVHHTYTKATMAGDSVEIEFSGQVLADASNCLYLKLLASRGEPPLKFTGRGTQIFELTEARVQDGTLYTLQLSCPASSWRACVEWQAA